MVFRTFSHDGYDGNLALFFCTKKCHRNFPYVIFSLHIYTTFFSYDGLQHTFLFLLFSTIFAVGLINGLIQFFTRWHDGNLALFFGTKKCHRKIHHTRRHCVCIQIWYIISYLFRHADLVFMYGMKYKKHKN